MLRSLAGLTAFCALLLLGSAKPVAPTYDNLNAVLWMQTAVEYRASTGQTYHAAESALLRGLKNPHWTAALDQTRDFRSLPPG